MEDNQQLQPIPNQDLVVENQQSEAEQHLVLICVFFLGSVPLMAITQVIGLGLPGLVISAAVAGGVAMGGKKLLHLPAVQHVQSYIPKIYWNRLLNLPDPVEEEPDNVVEADPPQDQDEQTDRQAETDEDQETVTGQRQEPAQAAPSTTSAQENDEDIDLLFQRAQQEISTLTLARLKANDIIRNTPPDSYRVCIGRSLTRKGAPPIWISFYKQHLKLIGASQYGKSSMAAALLYLITRTHSPNKVLVALLDLEYKTSRLFTNLPHLAAVSVDGKTIPLHAKNHEQVLEYLEYIVAILEERYKLSEAEVEEEPILLVYLEEFLDLRDHFKKRKDKTDEYGRLVHAINRIARRGLKAKIQLLMCAQVNYRDEEFLEALVNINCGMSFCVKTTAAQAAGFSRSDLLKRNVEMNEKGVAVVEVPTCQDLVHALDYDLAKKLIALAKSQQGANPTTRRAGMLSQATGSASPEHVTQPVSPRQEESRQEVQQSVPTDPRAALRDANRRKLTYHHHQVLEHYQPGMGYRELGEKINVGKDKAGELKKDLVKWGFLEDDGGNQ